MSNSYYNHNNPLTPGTTAKAEDINSNMDGVAAGFDLMEPVVKRAIKLPTSVTTDQAISENAAARANKVMAFDENGDLILEFGLGQWQGTWTTGTAYNKRDVVRDAANNLYVANTAHTATTWAADSANWTLVLESPEVTTDTTTLGSIADEQFRRLSFWI
jgi:hypothetical protein